MQSPDSPHSTPPRADSCFSGVIEFFVPPYPPAYTPMAVPLPSPHEDYGQIGVTLVRTPESASSAPRSSRWRVRSREPRFVFKLQQDATGFCKYVSLTRGEFNEMMAQLKATFPTQLESHFVVDVKKIWFVRLHRVFAHSEQDLLHTFRQLVMIPEVLESAFFHRSLALSTAEAMALVTLAERVRAARRRSQQLHARMDEETKRMTKLSHENDLEYAELVFSKLFLASRYRCSEAVRQPLLAYDHDMLLRVASLPFPHRERVVTGPGDHIYFHLRRRHRRWRLADTFNNDLAEMVEESVDSDEFDAATTRRSSLLLDRARWQRFTVRRAFPACRVHQQRQNFQLLPCFTAVGDRHTKMLEVRAAPSCGAFASLGEIVAELQPQLRHISHHPGGNSSADGGSSTLVSYKITARHASGFTFFLGTYVRKTRQRVHVHVHPGQDLIAMLMLAQVIDTFVAG